MQHKMHGIVESSDVVWNSEFSVSGSRFVRDYDSRVVDFALIAKKVTQYRLSGSTEMIGDIDKVMLPFDCEDAGGLVPDHVKVQRGNSRGHHTGRHGPRFSGSRYLLRSWALLTAVPLRP